MIFCDCNCQDQHNDGIMPEYYVDKRKAIEAVISHWRNNNFWSVHLYGKHILAGPSGDLESILKAEGI